MRLSLHHHSGSAHDSKGLLARAFFVTCLAALTLGACQKESNEDYADLGPASQDNLRCAVALYVVGSREQNGLLATNSLMRAQDYVDQLSSSYPSIDFISRVSKLSEGVTRPLPKEWDDSYVNCVDRQNADPAFMKRYWAWSRAQSGLVN